MIVLDLNLPDVNGLDGVVRLRQAEPDRPIVVVSSLDELRLVRAVLRAGVNAFVPKNAGREEFRQPSRPSPGARSMPIRWRWSRRSSPRRRPPPRGWRC